MKIHIKNESILLWIILFTIIVNNRFFKLIYIDAYTSVICSTILIFIANLSYISIKDPDRAQIRKNKWISYYYAIYLLFILVQFVSSRFNGYTVKTLLYTSSGYLTILLLIPTMYIFIASNGYEAFLNRLAWIVGLSFLLVIIFAFVYNKTGKLLFDQRYEMSTRNGRLRVAGFSNLACLIGIWSFRNILQKGKNWGLYVFAFIIIIVGILYVDQTRAIIVSIIASCLFAFLSSNNYKGSPLLKWILIICMVVFVINSSLISDFISTFSIKGEYGSSSTVRLSEYKTCWDVFKNNPINGAGLSSTKTIKQLYGYRDTTFGYDDVGFVGLLAQIGIWSILIYVIPIIRFISILHCTKKNNDDGYVFLIGLICYLLVSSLTIIITDMVRIIVWPFIIAIFEYESLTNNLMNPSQ